MKPRLARDILREESAYKTGRVIAGILLFLVLAGCAVIIGVMCVTHQETTMEVAIIAGAVVQTLVAIALYELTLSLFDRADSALRKLEIEP